MLIRVLNTVRYLKPVQVYGRIFRGKPRVASPKWPIVVRDATGRWCGAIPRRCPIVGQNRFRFLNQERTIHTWNDDGVPKLWLYNLHYFDCPNGELIQKWIAESRTGEGNGWEPYPLSLRIPNWIKWQLTGNRLDVSALANLAVQAEYLRQSVEYHLLGNHLLVNGNALVFAGAYFQGHQADRWLGVGLEILRQEIREQILPDGGHFERSPMYHALILEHMLDLINLAAVFPSAIPDADCQMWRDTASRMLGWLGSMSHSNGQIPFFNDAALGIAPEQAALDHYADRLGVIGRRCRLNESGYIRLESGSTVVLFDAAPVGPEYQPGHAHADTLSFEVSHRGKTVLVNSGTSTYEAGSLRSQQRSTPAHNTASVDDLNSSEVWGAFRVARRARPFDVKTDHRSFAEAAHSGYHRLSHPITHRRRLELEDKVLRVIDNFEGSGEHRLKLFFHLHPNNDSLPILDPQLTQSIESSDWYPEFNMAVPNHTVIGSWKGKCPASFATHIVLH